MWRKNKQEKYIFVHYFIILLLLSKKIYNNSTATQQEGGEHNRLSRVHNILCRNMGKHFSNIFKYKKPNICRYDNNANQFFSRTKSCRRTCSISAAAPVNSLLLPFQLTEPTSQHQRAERPIKTNIFSNIFF